MSVDTLVHEPSAPATDVEPGAWSSAEFYDEPIAGGFLRALVCPFKGGKWHWSVSSFGGVTGELISSGIATSAVKARRAAMSEVTKCIEDPFG